MTRWLERALALASVVAIVAAVATVLIRIAYPFELEWTEGWCREHVWRLREGLGIYVAPSLGFAPANYPPLFFHVAEWVSRLFGEGFLPLRLTSALASGGTALLVAASVRRETAPGEFRPGGRRAFPALVAAGLFAASAPWHGYWFDIARPDALHTFLLLASAATLRAVRPPLASGALAGALLALAFFTKQSAAVAILPLVLLLAIADPLRAAALGGTAAALAIGGLAILDRATQGWHGWYVFQVAAAHHPTRALLPSVLIGDLAPVLPALLRAAWGVARASARHAGSPGGATPALATRLRSAHVFWAAAAAGPLASGLVLRLYPGGWKNVLLPAAAFLAVLSGLALDSLTRAEAAGGDPRTRQPGRTGAAIAMAVLLVQFACFARDPRAQWPARQDRAAGDRVVATLRALPGGVYVPAHPYLARLAGEDPAIHEMALLDVLGLGDSRARALEGELREALASDRWRAAVVDHSERREWLYALIEKHFPRADSLAIPPGAFWCVTGARTRPERVLSR